ncbi:MAG: hypothetical protein Q8941_22055 [Bacteroidota bacterium]|nr:hypothetical protein [Bacteroidota bacterium]
MQSKWFIIAVLLPVVSFSQGNSSRSSLNTIVSVGMASGQSTAKPLFQWTGGMSYGRYFSGVGIGYDQYQFNSIPVFADWRMGIGQNKLAFVYADGGYNFPGSYKSDPEYLKTSDRLKGGFYMDAGIGYRIPLSRLHRLVFSAGYSRKNNAQEKIFTYPCGVDPCIDTPQDVYTYHYNFSRIITKLSWELGK